MTLRIKARSVGVSDLLKLAFYGESIFSEGEAPKALRDALEDNKRLHYFIGLDNEKSVAWKYRGWTIVGIPDQVFEDRVVEGKVVRKTSRKDKLLAYALVQGYIYARALGVDLIEIMLFDPMRRIVYQNVFPVDEVEPIALPLIDMALDIVEGIVSAAEKADEAADWWGRLISNKVVDGARRVVKVRRLSIRIREALAV